MVAKTRTSFATHCLDFNRPRNTGDLAAIERPSVSTFSNHTLTYLSHD
ncbi:hypothetical protein RBSH_00709 [Rhodopirellula baltica SH28]|uniref:Uncharacterized protein n=1 Tax=Rhodopirellula baltica SH28 TaxID=993517 RepID=K5DN94_RHOBT|nr:hypothetical protein RBSH_00709 [Rhodopirellula baltica SH28]